MKHILTLLLCLMLGFSAQAQTAEWDFHPLNTEPCGSWINPNGCGGCSSCGDSQDDMSSVLDGGYPSWTSGIEICPHPLDTTYVENILNTTGWDVSFDTNAYFMVSAAHFESVHIDSLIVVVGRFAGSCNEVRVGVDIDGDYATVAQSTITGILDTTVVTNLGCTSPFGAIMVYLRAGGNLNQTGQMFIKSIKLVTSECLTTQVEEMPANALYRLVQGGIYIHPAQDVSVFDLSGRIKFTGIASGYLPITELSIVRIGEETNIVMP